MLRIFSKSVLFSVVLITVLMMTFTLSGCKSKKDSKEPASSTGMSESEAQQLNGKVPVKVYMSTQDGEHLKLAIRYLPECELAGDTQAKASVVLSKLIEGPLMGENLAPVIPMGTKLLSPVTVFDGIATVDFSSEFLGSQQTSEIADALTSADVDADSVADSAADTTAVSSTFVSANPDTAAAITIYAVVNSLTELEGIEKVNFLIEGRQHQGTLGRFRLDLAFPRYEAIITGDQTPGATKPAASSKKSSVSADEGIQVSEDEVLE